MISRSAGKMLSRSLYLIVASVVAGCLSPISIDIDQARSTLVVVSGQVSTLPDRTFAEVALSAGPTRLPAGIADATVQLIDEYNNIYPFAYDTRGETPGNYQLKNFVATPGASYFIRVITSSGTFESRPERVPLTTATDSLGYIFADRTEIDQDGTPFQNKIVELYTKPTFEISQEKQFFKWGVEEVWMIVPTDFPDPFGSVPPNCFVVQPSDAQRITILDGTKFSRIESPRFVLAQRVLDQAFHTRLYFVSYLGSINEGAYDYWRKVNIIANQVGSIFDTPPSPLEGNIFNVERPSISVLGYFHAANESMKRTYLTQGQLPNRLNDYCEYKPDWAVSRYPNECIQCWTLRNSSYDRPSWFGEN